MANKEDPKKLLNSLLKNLSPEDEKKVQNILNDKNATDKILSTPQAQQLLQKLMGGK